VIYAAKVSGDYGATFISDNVKSMTGYEPREFLDSSTFWLEHVHPDDVDPLLSELPQIHERGRHTYEYRFRIKSGAYIWVRDEMKLHRDAEGTAVEIIGCWSDITDRKRAEEALRESEQKYRGLAENIPDVFFAMDSELRYTYWNKPSEDLTGIPAEDALAKSLYDIFPGVKGTEAEKLYLEVIRSRRPGTAENEYEIGNRQHFFELSAFPSAKGVAVLCKDITDRKRSEEALRRKVAELNSFLNNIPDMAWLKDRESNFIAANKAFGDAVGMDPAYLVKHTCAMCFGEEAAAKFREDDARVMASGQQVRFEESITDARGNTVRLETIKSPISDGKGEVVGTVGIARDVTERKQAQEREDQHRHRLQALTTQLSEIEERGRRRFARDLHDRVGQPLAMARMTLSDATGKLSDVDAVLRERIEAAGTLLEQASQETRAITLDLHPPILDNFGLGPAIEWAAEEFAKATGLKVVVRDEYAEPLEPPELRAYLFRAVKELLVNAAKHAEASEVVVHVRSEGDALHVSASDDGKGFDPDEATGRGGVLGGIGLFSIEERVASLGGTFQIESAPGSGSRFLIAVPLKNTGPDTEPRP
jgi:PAS domain S-box-containing protein